VSEDGNTIVLVSWATAWEMGIKYHRGLLKLPDEPRAFFQKQLALNRFDEAPICLDFILFSTELPWHHRDPFDRIVIAEVLRKSVEVVSSDSAFDAYGVRRAWSYWKGCRHPRADGWGDLELGAPGKRGLLERRTSLYGTRLRCVA
jgi:PIN domain nuclease of toxin-antitoxin system